MTIVARAVRVTLMMTALGGLTTVLGQVALAADPARLDGLVTRAAGFGAAVLSGWLALAIAMSALATLPGTVGRAAARAAARTTPAATRRVVHLVLGFSVAASAASLPSVASAAPPPLTLAGSLEITVADDEKFAALPHVGRPVQDSARTAMAAAAPSQSAAGAPQGALGWTPTIPAPSPPVPAPSPDVAVVSTPPRDGEAVPDAVVVRRGDSLWAIAARVLGPAASDAEIAATWPRWFDANRGVIGPDPDVITPGTVLRPPA